MINFKNLASSLLATSINNVVTTVVLTSGDEGKFPSPSGGAWAPIVVVDGSGNTEIMLCSARSGVNLTVLRGQEGTTALSFTAGARVEHRLTAAALEEIQTAAAAALTAGLSGKEPSISAGSVGQYWRGDKSWQTLNSTAVGLGNVDNTSDVNKPVSTAMTTALNLKAPLANPTFTGVPAAPTAAPGTNTTQLATTAFTKAAADAAQAAAIAGSYGKVVRRLYLSGATWTKPTGLVKVIVTVLGGGGGAGGHSNGSGTAKGGGGGGGGASIKEILAASLGATETVTVGAGGAGGNTSGSNGTTGGTSSFGAHCSATGGTYGNGVTSTGGAGGPGGVGSGGDVNLRGQQGPSGIMERDLDLSGAASALGHPGAAQQTTSSSSGNAATANSGAGGGGSGTASTAAAGGAGGSGYVIVEEYYV